ncbi:MAG: Gfo/Idh/MocA family oxidoreductase [Nitrososphaerota archaeon]|jgi:myo-inositol 2-dehydrogenase/D-chiro-inositol 1-dehydrogenase|nr:Gfo/Idh/MocA family oxidoreductase [Nitrososphaerota archaeon]
MHVEALSRIPAAELTAVCAGSEKSLHEAREETKVPTYLDYSDFLRHGGLDAVIIATPNHTHARLAVEALSSGKDVYLEKPIATTLEDAAEVVDSQRRAQRVVQIGFENRYSSLWTAVKSIIDKGEIGSPVLGKIESWRFPMRSGSGGWKYDRQRVGHQLFEEAIHYADLSNWLFGEGHPALRVSGVIDSKEPLTSGTFRCAHFEVEFEGGRRFLVADVLEGFGSDLSVMVAGDRGALTGAARADSDDSPKVESYLKVREKGDRTELRGVHPSGQLSDLAASLASFVGAVQGRALQGATVWDGYAAFAVCEAALRSAESGKPEPVRRLQG